MTDKNGGNYDNFSSNPSVSREDEGNTVNALTLKSGAKALLREGLYASLATEHYDLRIPYASLVNIATEPEGNPIILVSTLAIHTKNLSQKSVASLLFQQVNPDGDPLQAGRLSVWGSFEKTTCPNARQRFLARHPSATLYADFEDFDFYRMHIEGAHYVGGFGKIRSLTAGDILTDCNGKEELIGLEHGFLVHINRDHKKSVDGIAAHILDQAPAGWTLTGFDPEGLDFVAGQRAKRFEFTEPVSTPEQMKAAFENLANEVSHRHTSDCNCGHET